MADIFDELEDDLRAERLRGLSRRYGGLVAGLAVLLIVAAFGWQGWRWYEARQDAAAAVRYLAAMELADRPAAPGSPPDPAAIADFAEVAAAAPEGYRTLARLREAALQADAGQPAKAQALWAQVAADGDAPRLLRDLATLLGVDHRIDAGDPATLKAQLAPLEKPDNPWHGLAAEAAALIDLHAGQTAAARTALLALSRDISVSEGVRQRAGAVLARLDG